MEGAFYYNREGEPGTARGSNTSNSGKRKKKERLTQGLVDGRNLSRPRAPPSLFPAPARGGKKRNEGDLL